jgi:hypothetical protein
MGKRQSKANFYETNWISSSKAIQYVFGITATMFLAVFLASRNGEVQMGAVIFSIVLVVWHTYAWLFRGAFRIELKASELIWHSAFRTHQVSYDDIQVLRPFIIMPRLGVLEAKRSLPVLIWLRYDFGPTLERLQHKAPEMKVLITIPDEKHFSKEKRKGKHKPETAPEKPSKSDDA